MNLRAMANAATSMINPNLPVILYISGERVIEDDGTATIPYTEIRTTAQMQPARSEDLMMLEGKNEGAVYKVFYINGDLHGLASPKAADRIFCKNNIYKVISQQEGWNDTAGWTRVLTIRQEEHVPTPPDPDPDPEPDPDPDESGTDDPGAGGQP